MKGLLFLIFGLIPCLAFANGPGPAALDFLEKARDGELDLEPGGDTALLANTTAGKLRTIRKGIERLRADLGGGELEIGDVKEDEGYAAVMIRKVAGFDTSEIRVYPVALVKRGGLWLPAPVMASFENTVDGYTLPLRARLSGLEGWMMRKRVIDLGMLIARSADRTRELVRKSVIGENLEGDDLRGIADDFLQACADGDRAAILGFLGGLADPLPDDWAARLAASRLAAGGRGSWRLLAAPEIVRVPVLVERTANSGMVSFACLDPSLGTGGKFRIIHIDFTKDGSGLWRMDLPEALLSADEELPDHGEGFDMDLLDRFPEQLRKLDPAIREPTARQALDGVLGSLKSARLRDLLRRVDFGKDGKVAISAAAGTWWSIREPGALRIPLELGFMEEGDSAAAVFQWFSMNDADRYEPITLFFKKSPGGWVWCPSDETAGHKEIAQWVRESEPGWRLAWRGKLMEPGKALGRLGFERVATEAEVRGLMAEWMGALGSKDISHALSLAAWLGGEGAIPMKALRNLSYDLGNYREGEWRVERIHRSASWAAASVRQVAGGKVRNAFIPVVITGSDPRLLPEIDLFGEDNRTRNFLNQASFERLGQFCGKDQVEELKELFMSYRKNLTTME